MDHVRETVPLGLIREKLPKMIRLVFSGHRILESATLGKNVEQRCGFRVFFWLLGVF